MPKSKYTKKSCTRRSGTDSPGTERAETVQVSALSVFSAGLSPAPDYFSAGSTWQAFEPSYAHFT